MKNNTSYICTLSDEQQEQIRKALEDAGFDAEDIELTMNSRVCDVEIPE